MLSKRCVGTKLTITCFLDNFNVCAGKDKDKDSFIGPQEFVVGCSKAPEQPQSSARPICQSHTMTNTGREPATIHIAAYIGARRATHCAMGDVYTY